MLGGGPYGTAALQQRVVLEGSPALPSAPFPEWGGGSRKEGDSEGSCLFGRGPPGHLTLETDGSLMATG